MGRLSFGLSFLSIIFGFWVQAETIGKIKQIDIKGGKAVVSLTGTTLTKGNQLVATFNDQTQCFFTVTKTMDELAVISLEGCAQTDQLKVGQSLEKSLVTSADVEEPTYQNNKSPAASFRRRRDEDWYVLFGLGFNSIKYEDEIQQMADNLEAAPGVSHSSLGMDFFGFYWPVYENQTMMGVVVNSAVDTWEGPGGTLSIYQYLLGFSTYHFFNSNVGDGWFVRGDVGLSWYSLDLDTIILDYEESSDKGFGFLLGGGYAFPIAGGETSVLISLLYAHRTAEDDTTKTTSILGSFLF